MAEVDKRIGYMGADSGEQTYPELTLSGQEYSHIGGLHQLSDGKRFVILDQDTPRGFDVLAELAKLDPPKEAVIVPTKPKKATDES